MENFHFKAGVNDSIITLKDILSAGTSYTLSSFDRNLQIENYTEF